MRCDFVVPYTHRMGLLGDRSLDARARTIIGTTVREPGDELLERATLIEEAPSPAMLQGTARWLGIIDELRAAGLTDDELLRVALNANRDDLGHDAPTPAVLEQLLSAQAARLLADELLALPERTWRHHQLASVALAKLGAVDARDEVLVTLDAEPTRLRTIIGALPPDRREALVLKLATPATGPKVDTPRNALFIVKQLRLVWDLVESPALTAARDHALEVGKVSSDYSHVSKFLGKPFAVEVRPTRSALRALAHWTEARASALRAKQIGPRAAQIWSEHNITVDAKELATVETWTAASPARQQAIALAVVDAVEKFTRMPTQLVDIVAHGGPPIALLDLDGLRFCLVPGGTFELGFSEEEEAAVRAQAEVDAGCDNHYELYGSLFDQLDLMRPIQRVTVGPLLAMQGVGEGYDLHEAAEVLANTYLRVPSEAEWEYLARGGTSRELTYRGDIVPVEAAYFRETSAAGPKGGNAFRMWGFGIEPELCADVMSETHDGLPLDGSPRRGDGPRVVRGGAGQLFPWQDTGEWHLMLSAMRVSQRMWEFEIALRYVLGIRLA